MTILLLCVDKVKTSPGNFAPDNECSSCDALSSPVIPAPDLGPDGCHGGLGRGAPPATHPLLTQNTGLVRYIFLLKSSCTIFVNLKWESLLLFESTNFLFIKFHKLSNISP